MKLYSLLAFYHNAYSFKQWLKRKYFKPGHPDYVIYTFWFHTNTLGAAMITIEENLRIVTRAHRYDIFDDQVVFRSHYLRKFTLSRIENVFACSNDGAKYIKRSYPLFADKIKTSYLGTRKLLDGYSSPNENPRKLTFLSVSRLHPVKRVPLIYFFLTHLAFRYPELTIEWIHVGEGEERDKVEEAIKQRKPENLTPRLLGTLQNEDVQQLYLEESIDWFINLSSSEGLPVSMCEAMSYGVPVIGTNVGGVSEIVTQDTGILLQEPTEIETFIIEISKYINGREAYHKLRKNAAAHWQQHFDAKSLREKFAADISKTDG